MQIYDNKYYLCRGYKLEKTNKQLIYYHIPKTGGTTICNILHNLFKSSFRIIGSPTNERDGHSAYEYFFSNKKNILDTNFDFIYGHFQYCISNYFPNRLSITTLRDPVERCISHYNMIMGKKLLDTSTNIEECFKKNLSFRHGIKTPQSLQSFQQTYLKILFQANHLRFCTRHND